VSFFGAMSVIWLRSEGKVFEVVSLQVGASAVMAVVATAALLSWQMQLEGVMLAMLISALVPAAVLPFLLGRRFCWSPRKDHLVQTLKFAFPVLVGYLAYFALNRFSTVLLQHHVSYEELGVFGLAQQIAMIVAMTCIAFGTALQPMIFASDVVHVNESLSKAGRLLILMAIAVFSALVVFGPELISFVAPHGFDHGITAMTVLAFGNFTLAATLMSETALLYHRKIKTSVMISIVSALISAGLSLWLVPMHHIAGGALAVAGGMVFRMLLSHWIACRLTGTSSWLLVMCGIVACVVIGWSAMIIQALPLAIPAMLSLKVAALAFVGVALFIFFRKSS
jgi:O-antigen/teichoic acid export membrane protein